MQDVTRHMQQLSDWLSEWLIDQRLADGVPGMPERQAAQAADRVMPRLRTASPVFGDPGIAAVARPRGIYLLRRMPDDVAAHPWHVAVLAAGDEHDIVLAPFSRFRYPALPGELTVTCGILGLHVLQLWNARRVTAEVLAGAWWFGLLSREGAEQAEAVLDFLHGGHPLPASFASLVGPPIMHPADPRHSYRDTDQETMTSLAGKDRDVALLSGTCTGTGRNVETRLAAEARARYGLQRRWRIGSSALYLRITPRGETGALCVEILYEAGTRSRRLDGGHLRAGTRCRSLPIWNGMTDLPRYVEDDLLVLEDSDGSVIPVFPM